MQADYKVGPDADIKKYVDELSGSFEPDAYKNTTDAELLDDLKLIWI